MRLGTIRNFLYRFYNNSKNILIENDTIRYCKCLKEQKNLMQLGHKLFEAVRSTAYHFVNCSYHIFPCCFFANCAAWGQVNLHKFP